ncbi:MAG: prepilin-type N-terminal cleavage/methylation domain-containing protein [Candidatus Omnitrophica bacterium]|nr:prepilin-type N-terminal cleavage/methylation domain-containing protein [Candidatus Omnitrophota bacterium]
MTLMRNTDATDKSIDKFNQCNQSCISAISDKGFALIELLISVIVLSIGLVGCIAIFINCLNALQKTENRLCALQSLETRLHEIEEQVKEEGGIETGQSGGENWSLEASPVEAEEVLDLSEDLNEVTLRVWTMKESHNEEVSLITLMKSITDYTDEE